MSPSVEDLIERFRERPSDELKRIAVSSQFSAEAQAAARKLLLERGEEAPPPPEPVESRPPGPPGAAGPRRGVPVALVVLTLLSSATGLLRYCPRETHSARQFDPNWLSEVTKPISAERPDLVGLPEPPNPSPAPPSAPVVSPPKSIPFRVPQGPLSDPETTVAGTWIATVDDAAPRSAFMAKQVLFDLRDAGNDLLAVAGAVAADHRISSQCVWLELMPDRKGIRRECALANGQPSSLEATNPVTGEKSDLGTRFAWYWDAKARGVRILYEDDLLVPRTAKGKTEQLQFRMSLLKIGAADGEGRKIRELIPEHDFELPTQYTYSIYSGTYSPKTRPR